MEFSTLDLGLVDYETSLSIQRELARDISLGKRVSTLLLCEHNPVITLGRLADKNNILGREEDFKARGIAVKNTTRGGDVTLHLPGQLVAYPVFDLRPLGRDIHSFLRGLEKAAVLLLRGYGIGAQTKSGLTGVWSGNKKIASIGIAVSRWVAYHGMSINVDCDLDLFSLIRPCGQDIMMTSILKENAAGALDMVAVKKRAADKFYEVFCQGG
ncbi:lipoyl(octanoyl) transferase [bacterium]|nr:MAG: lipoyl(octanoyl) transferase [bacterium]